MERARLSSRLKAARQLHGGVDDNGKPKPLSVEDLVEREPLRKNGISVNRVREIEQLKVEVRPWEVEALAEALDLPTAWFEDEDWPSLIYAEGSPMRRQLVDERDLARLSLVGLRNELEILRRDQPPGEKPATGDS